MSEENELMFRVDEEIPTTHPIDDMTECRLKLVYVDKKKSKEGLTYVSIRLEPVEDEMANDIFHTIFLPRPDATKKQNNDTRGKIKDLLEVFGCPLPGEFNGSILCDRLKTAIGREIWALVSQKPAEGQYGPSNNVKKFLRSGNGGPVPF